MQLKKEMSLVKKLFSFPDATSQQLYPGILLSLGVGKKKKKKRSLRFGLQREGDRGTELIKWIFKQYFLVLTF